MAQFSWTGSQPTTGASKNMKVSNSIVRAAIQQAIFLPHADTETFGKHQGQSVTIMRVSQLTERNSWSINELDLVPESANTISAKLISVAQYGNSIPFTQWSADLAPYDLPMELQKLLRNDITRFMDYFVCNELKNTLYKYTPTGVATAQTATNGTAPAAAGASANVYHCERLRSLIKTTLWAEPVDGQNYLAFTHDDGALAIRRDPSWEIKNICQVSLCQ